MRTRYSRPIFRALALIARDMSPTSVSTISKNLPQATTVFDHFDLGHFSNEKLSHFRLEVRHHASKEGKKALWAFKHLKSALTSSSPISIYLNQPILLRV
jgi:transposase